MCVCLYFVCVCVYVCAFSRAGVHFYECLLVCVCVCVCACVCVCVSVVRMCRGLHKCFTRHLKRIGLETDRIMLSPMSVSKGYKLTGHVT